MDDPPDREILAYYPYVLVRLGCDRCTRKGASRLARLAAKFGPNISLDQLIAKLVAAECPYWKARHPDHGTCRARLIDLDGFREVPDLPPAILKLPDVARTAAALAKRAHEAGLPESAQALEMAALGVAPSQEFQVIRQNHNTGERSIDLLKWGLIPYWCKDPKGGRKPINAKAETVASLPTFREAYARRRCIMPVDGFFEWRAAHGGKQPYAIAMKDGSPFGIAGIWENWKDPTAGEWTRTFAVITVPANDLVAQIHDRMPSILKPDGYDRWLGVEPDPRDLLISFPPEPMRMWPISKRVNTPKNDDASLLNEVTEEAA